MKIRRGAQDERAASAGVGRERNEQRTLSKKVRRSDQQPAGLLYACLVGLWFLTACTTLPKYKDVQLPAYALSYFSECTSREGAVTFALAQNAQTSGNLDMEWTSNPRAEWTLASYSPIGQTLFQVEFSKNPLRLNKTGRQSAMIEDLDVDGDGYIRFKGQLLGMKAEEIGCLLDMKLPRTWLKQVVDLSTEDQGLRLDLIDRERRTSLRLAKHGSSSPILWTVEMHWSIYLGLKDEALKLELEKPGRLRFSSATRPEMSSIMTLREDEF
jgi:hypothetical protein